MSDKPNDVAVEVLRQLLKDSINEPWFTPKQFTLLSQAITDLETEYCDKCGHVLEDSDE